jgi:hypothetical protein
MNDEADEVEAQRQALKAEFAASRAEQRAGQLGWGEYGLRLTSICERCADCDDACAGSVVLEAKIRGPEALRKGMTDEIRDLERRLAIYFR